MTDYIYWAALVAVVVVVAALLLLARTLQVIHQTHTSSRRPKPSMNNDAPATLAIFLGSGGHTAEMMRLLSGLDWNRYSTRIYIISSGDSLSETKALSLEKSIGSGTFKIHRIPRARKVLQSYATSPFTTLYSLAYCLWIITVAPLLSMSGNGSRRFADAILLNGPGSCVPIAFAAFLPRILALPSPSLIYIESLARTQKLSLSAKIVRLIVDRFFVQWESLREKLGTEKRFGGLKLWADVECEGWLV